MRGLFYTNRDQVDVVLGIDDAVVDLLVDLQTNKGLTTGRRTRQRALRALGVRLLRKVSCARLCSLNQLRLAVAASVDAVVFGVLPTSSVTT